MNQNIEGIVDNLRLRGAEVLKQIETRAPIRVQGHELAVDHRSGWQAVQRIRDEPKLFVEDIFSPREECRLACTADGFEPISIELDLIRPLWPFWDGRYRQAFHSLDEASCACRQWNSLWHR